MRGIMSRAALHFHAATALVVTLATAAHADVVETKNGARLVGNILKIEAGAITLHTDYAGDLVIKQAEVASVKTDDTRFVRLSGGTVMAGTVAPTSDGKIQIVGEDGTITTTVEKLAATWAPGTQDPAVAAALPKWTYEAAADITGKTGNREQNGAAVSVRAKRTTATETLQFYSAYNRQETNRVVSADQLKVGVDFANNFSGRKSWYMRDEGGFDRVKDIEFYNIAASGLGYDFIKEANHLFTGRAGLAFRFEGYGDPATSNVKSFGLDFGLRQEITFSDYKLINSITYVPGFDDFSNFRSVHESYFEVPLASPRWKLRLGVTNDYTSKPATGVKSLDTTYFTRFVLNWY